MSTRVRALLISGGLMVAMLFGALAGPAFVDAQTPRWRPPVPWEIPQDLGDGPVVNLFPTPTPTVDGGQSGQPNAEPGAQEVTCHIDGCRIPIRFVTDDGEVVKTMVITFEDGDVDTAD